MARAVHPIEIAPVAKSVALSEQCRPISKSDDNLSFDVIIIGTGAGGAVAGTEFARAGLRTVFLEAGGAFAQPDFQKKSLLWSITHMYSGRGAQLSQGNATMVVASGRGVGGSTLLNSAICFRPPEERLREWAKQSGAQWLLPEPFSPFVEEIWRRIGVVPTYEAIGRRNNVLLRSGLEKIGAKHAWMDRNAPGCVGCGVCHLGCPSGGKASVDKSILPEAARYGAQILTRARVENIDIAAGKATGVQVSILDENNEEVIDTISIKAPIVVVAASALVSPLILRASNLGNDSCGANLAVHPSASVLGEFPDPVVMWDGVPQGYWGKDPNDERVLIESANIGAGELFAILGRAGVAGMKMAQRFSYLALAGGMLRDQGGGQVKDLGGCRPDIRYHFQERDMQGFRAGMRTVVRAYFAAGAKSVCPVIEPMQFYDKESDALKAIDAVKSIEQLGRPYSSHPQGTCRLGPATGTQQGTVDTDGHVHGVSGVYVMDGSLFPTTLGVNPQVTIMAMSLALSRMLVAQL